MSRRRILFFLLFLLVLLYGCAKTTQFEESDLTEQSTVPPSTVELRRDYIGEIPSEAELCAFFSVYGYDTVKERMSQEEVLYCGHVDNYAVLLFSGMGPKVNIYEYTYSNGCIQVLSKASGEIALSGGLSINHIEKDGQHFYFGSCSDYHWNSIDETRFPIDWLKLRVIDENNEITTIDMSEEMGYLCILDAPMTDFQVIDQDESVCLNYVTFFAQKYYINETEFYPLQ